MPSGSRLLVQVIKDVTIVRFTDSSVIESHQIEAIKEELFTMIDQEYKKRMVLDLAKVHHFSSTALGMLIPMREKIAKAKGDLILCGLRPEIRKIFKITKLEKQFRFCDDEKAALAALHVVMD